MAGRRLRADKGPYVRRGWAGRILRLFDPWTLVAWNLTLLLVAYVVVLWAMDPGPGAFFVPELMRL